MKVKYPSQQNRVIFWLSPEHRDKLNRVAARWGWTAKQVAESLIDLADEGEIEPIAARATQIPKESER